MTTVEALEREADKHRLIVRKIESLIRDLNEISRPQPELALPDSGAAKIDAGTTAAAPRFAGVKQIDAIEAILREKGQATSQELFECLTAGGINLAKRAYLSSILSRTQDRFEHIGRGRKSRWRLLAPKVQ